MKTKTHCQGKNNMMHGRYGLIRPNNAPDEKPKITWGLMKRVGAMPDHIAGGYLGCWR